MEIINQEIQGNIQPPINKINKSRKKMFWIVTGLLLSGLGVGVAFAAPPFIAGLNTLSQSLERLTPTLAQLDQMVPYFQSFNQHAASIDENIGAARQLTNEMDQSLDGVISHLDSIHQQSQNLIAELHSLSSMLKNVSASTRELNDNLRNLNQKMGALSKNIQEMSTHVTQTKGMLTVMAEEMRKANQQSTQLKTLLKDTDNGLAPLLPQLQETEEKLKHLTALTKEINQKLPNVQIGEITYLNEMSTQLEQSILQLTERLNQLSDSVTN